MTTENKRDLAADLAICEAAASAFTLHQGVYAIPTGGTTVETEICRDDYEPLTVSDTEFILEAREGWPEAIRRAIAAEAEVEKLRRENVRLQAQIDYVKYTCGELAETYRIYAEEGADRGSSLERVYSGMSIAYEDAVDMFEPEVPANE